MSLQRRIRARVIGALTTGLVVMLAACSGGATDSSSSGSPTGSSSAASTAVSNAASGTESDTGSSSSSEASTPKQESHVDVSMAIVAAGETPTAYTDEVKRFNQSHPNITLSLQTYPSGDAYNQALLGQVAGGAAPDVFLLDLGTQMQQFVDAKAILPMSGPAEQAGIDMGAFDQNLTAAATIGGQLYAVPKDYSTTVLTYRKSALAAAGVQPPTTWADLRTAAKKLTKNGQYGLGMYPQINYLLAWIDAFGGNFATANGISNFDNPDHVRALDEFLAMFNKDKSIATPQMTGASWDGEMLAKRQVAMVFGGSWVSGGVPAADASDIGEVTLPPEKQNGSVLYATGWVISAGSRHPDAAAEVIKFLTSDEELIEAHKAGIILLPPKASALDTLLSQNDDPLLKIAQSNAENGVPFGWLTSEQVDAYNGMLSQLTSSGTTSSQSAITALAKTIG